MRWGFFVALVIPNLHDTVDGSEIRRSPVEVGSLSTIIYDGFQKHPTGGWE